MIYVIELECCTSMVDINKGGGAITRSSTITDINIYSL